MSAAHWHVARARHAALAPARGTSGDRFLSVQGLPASGRAGCRVTPSIAACAGRSLAANCAAAIPGDPEGAMTRRWLRARVWPWASVLMLIAAAMPGAQHGAVNGEWRTYGGDLGHTRYAPLDQINAANFGKLEVAWRFKTDNLGPAPGVQLPVDAARWSTACSTRPPARAARSSRSTPATRRAALGAQPRRRDARRGRAARSSPAAGSPYWTDGKEERILYVTPGYRLVALDAQDRAADAELRQERRRRSEAATSIRMIDPLSRRDRPARGADRREGRRHRRRRAPVRRRADEQDAT